MKKITFILLVLYTTLSFAQITISGVVKDKDGNPLDMANVIAMNVDDASLEGYSITEANGKYRIKLSKLGNIELKVSYLGFDSQSKLLVISEKETVKDFVLKEAENNLDDVEITYTMPVTIKGDTIVYNADSFTNGKEKKLGDVLEKLPGIDVNKEGEIEIEGKKVSKVYVEGKEFFDGDTKLAVKNIPADAIKKVEVLKNHNEVSQMRGLGDDSDSIAINIKLKEGKKNFWFGEVTAGAGEGDGGRYLAHPKLFYYSPNKSINVITDVNNIGEIPFTFRDYFKFSGGFKNMMKSGGLNISSNSLGLSFLKDNKAKEITNNFGAVNYSQAITKNLDFNGFAIFSKAENVLHTNTNRTTISQNNTLNEISTDKTNQDNTLGLLKLAFGYKPNNNFQLDYDAIIKVSDLNESNATNSLSTLTFGSTSSNSTDNINSSKAEKPFSVKQSTNAYYTLNDKNIFAFESQFLIEKNNPLYNSINATQRFANIPTNNAQANYNISQNKKISTQKIDAKLDYYYVLNNKSNINFTLGSTLNSQSLQSNIFQTLDDKSVVNFTNADLNNDVDFNYSDVFLGVHYKLKTGIFTLTPGLSVHQYTSKNRQLGTETKKTPFYVLPDFTARIQLKRSENFNLNYSISTNFTDINKLSEGVLFNSYNSLSQGNRELTNGLYHKYSLFYSNYNMFSFTHIFAGINYSKKYDVIKRTSPIGLVRINSSLNSFDPDDNLSVNARFSKRFKKVNFKVSGNGSLSNTNRLITTPSNTVISEKTTYLSQNYKTSLSTNFNKWPNFEVGYETSLSEFDNSNSINQKPFANIEIVFLKDFILTSDYAYNRFTDSNDNTNVYDFLNAILYYQKEGSQWEFKASVINLLDTKSINDDYFSTDYQSTSQYFVQPRYLMFTVKYDL